MSRRPDLKEAILREAACKFRTHGYDATTLQAIAETLGITKGAITYHVQHKYMLLVQLIHDFFAAIWAETGRHPALLPTPLARAAAVTLCCYGRVLRTSENMRLFYHPEHLEKASSRHIDQLGQLYRQVDASASDEAIRLRAIMDFGARKQLFAAYQSDAAFLSAETFARQHVLLLGSLSQQSPPDVAHALDQAAIFMEICTGKGSDLFD